MDDEITFRAATAGDARFIQRVARDFWHAVYDSILGADTVEEAIDSWFDPARLVADDILPDDRPLFVAETDEAVVGFVEIVPEAVDDGTVRLYRLSVDPEHWGNGIGSGLPDQVESTLGEQGVGRLRLSVLTENETAVGFYEARGFDRVGHSHDGRFGVKRYEYTTDL